MSSFMSFFVTPGRSTLTRISFPRSSISHNVEIARGKNVGLMCKWLKNFSKSMSKLSNDHKFSTDGIFQNGTAFCKTACLFFLMTII